MVGRTLQRYKIVEEVGHGGMSVVYRGVDASLEREVAIKLLHPHLASRPEHRRRLAREAKAVARLHHPNILEIYDFSGEDSAEAYIVTELIRGRTLRTYAQEHAFDPPELAAACVHTLAGALAHAHAQHIIHRDLKPDNVMIREDGAQPTVKLMDFGIAQILDRDERMTVTGSLIGSPAHMAPEIIDGEDADERSDIFSIGTMLYWLATGELPFEAASPGALLKKILEGDYRDPREIKPGMSDALADVIRSALDRDRTKRIASATDLQQRLASALLDSGIARPEELLAEFLLKPAETSRQLKTRLVDRLMQAGAEAAGTRRMAKALGAYSRVIAMVPGTPEAGAARQAIDRLKSRAAWRRRTLVIASAGLVASTAWAVVTSMPAPPIPVPLPPPVAPLAAPEVTRPAIAWVPPKAPEAVTAQPALVARPLRTKPEPITGVLPARVDQRPPVTFVPSDPPVPVTIRVSPYARISIDSVFKVERPVYIEALAPGRHVVEISRECCETFRRELDVVSGQEVPPVVVELVPKPALVKLVIDGPADTVVTIDDSEAGLAGDFRDRPVPVVMKTAKDGRLRYERDVVLRFFRAGFKEVVRPVPGLRAGETRAVSVTMEQAG